MGEAPFQVQVRTTCLACGRGADDEFCVGPFLTVAHVEFDTEEFSYDPLSDAAADFSGCLHRLPMVVDAEGNEIPNHVVLRALRGEVKPDG